MKYIIYSISIIFVGLFGQDILNWSIYEKDFFHRKTTKNKLKYSNKKTLIFENNNFTTFVFDSKKHTFGVSTTKPDDRLFFMNSNFFDESTIGLVVENGIVKSSKVHGGGYFFVRRNKVDVIVKKYPMNVNHASQTILWGINDGLINKKLIKQNHAKVLTYRNLVGKNKNGDIIFIVSNEGGVVTIEDVINEGLKMKIVEGILFDGGSSVEYRFDDKNYSNSFTSLSTTTKKILNIGNPTTYIYVN